MAGAFKARRRAMRLGNEVEEMERRKQFTFYRSYYDAIKALPRREQTEVVLALCAYGLDKEERMLSGTAAAIFTLIKPTLDAAWRKAEGGSKGTADKES